VNCAAYNDCGCHWFIHFGSLLFAAKPGGSPVIFPAAGFCRPTAMRERRDSCAYVMKRLTDYVESELSPGNQQRVAQHLRDCASCTRLLEDLRRTRTLLSQLPKPQPPPHLTEKILKNNFPNADDT
jgi:hypothetical protein